jgi:hypothetical protein
MAYFNSYALWNYLTIPFLYTYSGFVIEELRTWFLFRSRKIISETRIYR